MTKIKIKHVISFSSQDPRHTVESLISGRGAWLSESNGYTPNIKAEFQLEKASKVEYIDLGNNNTAMLNIEVGQSSWSSSSPFKILLPTVVLMNPIESRNGDKAKAVRMFKNADFIQETSTETWDRVRITCQQPFRKDCQYGLTFINFYAQDDKATNDNLKNASYERTKQQLFESVKSIPSKKMSPSLQSIENHRIFSKNCDSENEYDTPKSVIDSPMSRGAKLIMAVKHKPNHTDALKQKKDLEMKALDFMISLNLTYDDIHSLKVSNLREEFERRRNSFLTPTEKLVFKHIALDYATEKLKKIDNERGKNPKENGADTRVQSFDTLSPIRPASTNILRVNNCSSELEKSSTEKTGKYTFTRFNKQNSPMSAKRSRMRDDDPIVPQSPRGFDRNSLSSNDCHSTTPNSKKCVTPKSTKRKRTKKVPPTTPATLNRWISAKNSYFVDLEDDVVDDLPSINGDEHEICDNSEYFEKKMSKSGVSLGRKPNDKYGITKNIQDNKNGSTSRLKDVVKCPLCAGVFPAAEIERHAEFCTPSKKIAAMMEQCPICQNMFDASKVASHAEYCAQEIFID